MSKSSKNIPTLTGVRGFAALWVVLYHQRDYFRFAFLDEKICSFIHYGTWE